MLLVSFLYELDEPLGIAADTPRIEAAQLVASMDLY
jgi:hypothetical protein